MADRRTPVVRPDRPGEDRQNIAFVHVCVAGQRTGTPDWESTEVRWFPLSELPEEQEFAFDHYGNIRLYRQHLANGFVVGELLHEQFAVG